MAQNAQAGVRVKATINTPNARVHFTNRPFGHYRSYTREVLPLRMYKHAKINKRDRMVARRLAGYTGVPKRTLINLRARGFRWFEIGRWLYVPRPVVRAAMNQRTWKRFLHRQRAFGKRGFGGPPRHRVSHIDPGYYENFGGYSGEIIVGSDDKFDDEFDDD
jgi:hypothetical protein